MIWEIFILPLLFGLLGFIEPCSLGINSIFLARIHRFTKLHRIRESLLFAFVRAFVLSLLGLGVAFVGTKVFTFQTFYFVILGAFYAMLGGAYIYTQYKKIYIPSLDFSRFAKKRNIFTLSVLFGLVIPACAIPLLLVLLGNAFAVDSLFQGFISLFIFGLGLSFPLVLFSFSNKSSNILKWISEKSSRVPYITGGLLIVLGIITALSSYWWITA
jgi:cytochrome c-type biogenesis protein